ncbi:hypothetical protein LshimejAT787_1004990 [Lyophyllum shimeji]|uniref:Uncharacterized protein n=1 Tax=Lyophyllum shimeji TaxID=47721 RepID=A0A9P3PUQ0_LYOSH|nr:hypothetical protein LshimejAT787_1004990 [Lyophyllum shimeji]
MIPLPVELIEEIVRALCTPQYPLQYGHKTDVLRTLRQLSLVNRLLFHITTPYLYSSIVISSHRELRAFLSISPSLRLHTTSLWLKQVPDSAMFPLIADLLRDLGPHLRRLALDIPGSELDTSTPVREALRCCIHLEDFTRSGYSPMQVIQPHPVWRRWTALRRLALDGPLINDTFINYVSELPHITHLALIEPRWKYSPDGTEIAAFLRLLEAGQRFQRVLLIYCNGDDLHLNSLRRLRAVLKLRGLREGLDILYMIKHEKAPAPMKMIRSQIGAGSLWDLHSRNILAFPIGCRLAL